MSANMPYKEPTTVAEITQRLELLQEQMTIIMHSLGPNHALENGNFKDVRIITVKECKHDISTTISLLNVFNAKASGYMSEAQWLQVFGIQPKDTPLSQIEGRIIHYLKLSLVTMYQFRMENMLTNILARFDMKETAKGYHRKVEALLDALKMKDKDTKLKKLDVLAFIRNSLHSGGIVNRYDLDVTIDGYRFNFKKGEKVKQAGWGHIFLAVESSLIVINEILHSKAVEDIPEPISASFIEPGIEKKP